MESQEPTQTTEANDTGSPDLSALQADLNSLESASGEEAPPQTQTEKLSPEEHSERSKLGRKVADLNDKFDRVLSALEQQNQRREPQPPVAAPPSLSRRPDPQDELPDIIATPEDVVRVLEARERKRNTNQQAYEQDYIWQLEQERSMNDDIHEQVLNEMFTNAEFNRKRTGHPIADAQYNYALALKATLRKESSKQRMSPNLKQESTEGIGVSTHVVAEKRTPNLPRLSPEAEHFLRKTGRSAEWASKALGEDLPISISGKVRG